MKFSHLNPDFKDFLMWNKCIFKMELAGITSLPHPSINTGPPAKTKQCQHSLLNLLATCHMPPGFGDPVPPGKLASVLVLQVPSPRRPEQILPSLHLLTSVLCRTLVQQQLWVPSLGGPVNKYVKTIHPTLKHIVDPPPPICSWLEPFQT